MVGGGGLHGPPHVVDVHNRYNNYKAAAYDKPTFVAEFGNGNGYKPDQPAGMDDPTGIYLHNGYWGGAGSLGAGGCMYVGARLRWVHGVAAVSRCDMPLYRDHYRSWWWDSYIDPANLYWRYNGISKFVQRVDWTTLKWTTAQVESSSASARLKVVTGVPLDQVRRALCSSTCDVGGAHGARQSSSCLIVNASRVAGLSVRAKPRRPSPLQLFLLRISTLHGQSKHPTRRLWL